MPRIIIHRKEAKTKYFIEDLGNDVQLEMIAISGGSFIMGAPEDELESRDSERPQHPVNVSSFHMGRYPVTQAQWREVSGWEQVEKELDPDPSRFKDDYEGIDRWTRPVENVSWDDAVEFCLRLSQRTGKEYRLPTEAEWEYACRSVISDDMTVEEWNKQYNQPFHFGETISTDLANYQGTDDESMGWKGSYGRGVLGEYRKQTTPIGYFKVANNFGLSDMHGNVWEWCEDDWHDNYDNAPNDGSAWRLPDGNRKVIRGGSWNGNPPYCRSAFRYSPARENRFLNFGFRVVCVAPRTT